MSQQIKASWAFSHSKRTGKLLMRKDFYMRIYKICIWVDTASLKKYDVFPTSAPQLTVSTMSNLEGNFLIKQEILV